MFFFALARNVLVLRSAFAASCFGWTSLFAARWTRLCIYRLQLLLSNESNIRDQHFIVNVKDLFPLFCWNKENKIFVVQIRNVYTEQRAVIFVFKLLNWRLHSDWAERFRTRVNQDVNIKCFSVSRPQCKRFRGFPNPPSYSFNISRSCHPESAAVPLAPKAFSMQLVVCDYLILFSYV